MDIYNSLLYFYIFLISYISTNIKKIVSVGYLVLTNSILYNFLKILLLNFKYLEFYVLKFKIMYFYNFNIHMQNPT